jgi:hypothetical protein
MQPPYPPAQYYQPPPPQAPPPRSNTGLITTLVTLGIVGLVLLAAGGVVLCVALGPSGGGTSSEVLFDNRSTEPLSIEVDGTVVDTASPRDAESPARPVRLADGKHTFRILDAHGAVKGSKTLELTQAHIVYPIGGKGQYAVVTVHYGYEEGSANVDDSARLLPSNADETLWQMPMYVNVDDGIDEAFAEKSQRLTVRHICRFAGGRAQCAGGPQVLTTSERFTGLGAEE